jgi:hypothetical protein
MKLLRARSHKTRFARRRIRVALFYVVACGAGLHTVRLVISNWIRALPFSIWSGNISKESCVKKVVAWKKLPDVWEFPAVRYIRRSRNTRINVSKVQNWSLNLRMSGQHFRNRNTTICGLWVISCNYLSGKALASQLPGKLTCQSTCSSSGTHTQRIFG